ncbi:MAG: hypothetical protein Q8L65_10835 [Burkholderiales bacterium]|nr:hypothetical protein [Burkholderiales bacterium]
MVQADEEFVVIVYTVQWSDQMRCFVAFEEQPAGTDGPLTTPTALYGPGTANGPSQTSSQTATGRSGLSMEET